MKAMVALFAGFVALMSACGGEDEDVEYLCEAGTTEACFCVSGGRGVSHCSPDGQSWEACGACEITITPGFVEIPPGSFTMGSSTTELCRTVYEDRHHVTLTHGFELQAHETTLGEYMDVMGGEPPEEDLEDRPVTSISWMNATAYCNELSVNAGLPECYVCGGSGVEMGCNHNPDFAGPTLYNCRGYRLPTEAEWEYAYRAGTTTTLYNGDLEACQGDDLASEIAWYRGNEGSSPHPVGQLLPNAWGLYDMAGNVWEMCHDNYNPYLGRDPVTDPVQEYMGEVTMPTRGGAYDGYAEEIRAAMRYRTAAAYGNTTTGFRCARTLTF